MSAAARTPPARAAKRKVPTTSQVVDPSEASSAPKRRKATPATPALGPRKESVADVARSALRPQTYQEFGTWLDANCKTSPAIWVALFNIASGRQTVNYKQLLDEALCHGWIDSRSRRLSETEFAVRFGPRKNTGSKNWSAVNRKRVKELHALNRMKPEATAESHCFGINSLAFDDARSVLYTAGRDSTIRAWGISQEPVRALGCYEYHSDWVTDIVLVEESHIVSCSSDCSIVLSSIVHSDDGHSVGTLQNRLLSHTDYVKKLQYRQGKLFSAGLDGVVHINALTAHGFKPISSLHSKHSLYTLAVDVSGHMVATAGSEQVIRVYDTRAATSVVSFVSTQDYSKQLLASKLKGHSDIIKALLMSADGKTCISGSSDGSIKLWDLSTGRSMQTLYVHADSVWNLWSDSPALETIFSCGRDGFVNWIDLRHTPVALPLCHESAPILSVLPVRNNAKDLGIWVATPNSDVTCWRVNEGQLEATAMAREEGASADDAPADAPISLADSSRDIPNGGSPDTTPRPLKPRRVSAALTPVVSMSPGSFDNPLLARLNADDAASATVKSQSRVMRSSVEIAPVLSAPQSVIKGRPAIIKIHILNNRYQVLTLNSEQTVQLWDVLRLSMVKDYGNVNFEKTVESLTTSSATPNWFSVDTKSGSLTVHLDYPQCFDAEVYAEDVEIASKAETIFNLGEVVLRSLFENWFFARREPFYADDDFLSKLPAKQEAESSTANPTPPADEEGAAAANHASQAPAEGSRGLPVDVAKRLGAQNKPNGASHKEDGDHEEEAELDDTDDAPSTSSAATAATGKGSESKPEQKSQPPPPPPAKKAAPGLPKLNLPDWTWVIISEENSRCVLRTQRKNWEGQEPIPTWVVDCVRDHSLPNRSALPFWVKPLNEEKLPQISKGRLTTTRALKVYKLAAYVVTKLGVELPVDPTAQVASEATNGAAEAVEPKRIAASDYVIISCKGKDLDPPTSMTTIKTHTWKSSADLILHYRINPVWKAHWEAFAKKRK